MKASRFHGSLVAILVACVGLLSTPVLSAEVAAIDSRTCQASLTGPIAAGDLSKLEKIVSPGSSLCLNSPGGDFIEGLAIAEWLTGKNVTTVIDDGASCYSACAIAFMGGSEWEEIYTARRKLHVNGRLGFHAPYLIALSKTYSGPDLEATYSEGLQAVARMMKLGADMGESLLRDQTASGLV